MLVTIVGVVSSIIGLNAARLWYRASKVEIPLPWVTEPVNPTLSNAGWMSALLTASSNSAELNRRASIWTAVSVALAAASNFLSMTL